MAKGKRSVMESFEEAKLKLATLLEKNGRSKNIAWIFRENVSQIKTATFHIGDKSQNEKIAKRNYEMGVEKGFGVALTSQFHTDVQSIVYVWFPNSKIDAEEHLQRSDLKLILVLRDIRSKKFWDAEIKNRLIWKLVKWLESKDSLYHSIVADIPKMDGTVTSWNSFLKDSRKK
jgi:hypothetical protein